jgi:peptide/nickel transport system substrate-binding protein
MNKNLNSAITKLQGAVVAIIIVIALIIGVYYATLPAPTPTPTPTPKPSKTFVNLQQYDFITDIDPAYSFSSEIPVMANVYEGLLMYTGGTPEVEPALATSYEVSEDGLTWTFHLRQGVKFHDGTPFNATAVKYSIDRIRKLGVGAVFIWDPVKEVKIIDTYTVQFILTYAAPLQRIVASCYGAWIYSPKTAEIENLHDWFNEGHEAGTGPYMIESLERGAQVVLKRFDDYWRGWEEHAPDRIDKVVFKIVEDATLRTEMIEKGEAHYAAAIPTEERKRLETKPEIHTVWVETFFAHYAFLNTKSQYLSNKLVRQALAYSFPYDEFVKWGEGAYTQPVGPIPSGMWGHFDDLFQYNCNLTKAKELLTEAGYPEGGFKLKYYYISGVGATMTAGEMWKEKLAELGIELEVRGMTWPTMWEIIKAGSEGENAYDICVFAWWPTYVTPYDFLFNMWHTEEKPLWNAAYYSNPEFDELIDNASKLEGPDPEAALGLYRQAQEILIEDCPTVFIDYLRNPLVLRSNVMGIVVNAGYGYDTFFYWYMWLAEE